jgi:malate dehydrogenase (oxaloacetate-decarboxylating)(NADP+)
MVEKIKQEVQKTTVSVNIKREDALLYHSRHPSGKIEVNPTKNVSTQRDLSLAYSPGVAEPCLEIAADPLKVYDYTIKGNLVAVLTNGTAVLGLGNIGPEASKPVMEGKAVLFKKFAGINVFDIEINATTPDEFVQIAKALEPTFGGINLEDIKAPECFEIERRLREEMKIPVMHDDQHGTAIISSAALLNAVLVAGKKMEEIRIVVSGAGAAAISCTRLYLSLGVKRENVVMLDINGVLDQDRTDLDETRQFFATHRKGLKNLRDALKDADVFVGLSAGNIMDADMVRSMADNPIIFAMANPNPEIPYDVAIGARPDAIVATGRSDFPNQVNNVLGFPFIFRGALDVRATQINEEMKIAAVKALAELAREAVPEVVNRAYASKNLVFGREYIIPKPLDPRLITVVSTAVAKAAMDSGVAQKPIEDFHAYAESLKALLGQDEGIIRNVIQKARKDPKRVIFAEADTYKILKAAEIVVSEKIAEPILLGNREKINALIEENHLELGNARIIDVMEEEELRQKYAEVLWQKRKRKGITLHDANKRMRDRNYFGAVMLEKGEADALISGLTKTYPNTIRPALEVIGKQSKLVAGMYLVNTKKGPYFFADTTVNKNPSAEELVEIASLSIAAVRQFNIEPRVAFLSYSNFGSNYDEETERLIKATAHLQRLYPDLAIDGELQANIALRPDLIDENYPFSQLAGKGANTLIFPNLMSGNISYKLMMELGDAEAVGPVLLGMKKPVHVLQLGSSVREIVNMVAIAVMDAQARAQEQQMI